MNIALYGSILGLLEVDALKKSKAHGLAFGGCIVTMTLMLLSLLVHLCPGLSPMPLLRLAVYLSVSFTMTCLGLTLIRAFHGDHHISYRLLGLGIGWCSLGFVPLGVMEYLIVLTGNKTYHPFSLEYLFYLGCNVVIIIAGAASLKRDPSFHGLFGEYDEEQGKRFSLIRRETEMVPLIAQGKTNKEIAFMLGISEATVRTQIYNLFQKVGASSRIELLHLLHD
ncbi:MAG: LuxR C-terminal-related transcriptional regulator [Sphaerochaeta sp.]